MEKLTALINEIQDCTLEIEVHYPELYKQLNEAPYLHLFSRISTKSVQSYLKLLKIQLEVFQNTSCHE